MRLRRLRCASQAEPLAAPTRCPHAFQFGLKICLRLKSFSPRVRTLGCGSAWLLTLSAPKLAPPSVRVKCRDPRCITKLHGGQCWTPKGVKWRSHQGYRKRQPPNRRLLPPSDRAGSAQHLGGIAYAWRRLAPTAASPCSGVNSVSIWRDCNSMTVRSMISRLVSGVSRWFGNHAARRLMPWDRRSSK
jgi:hypothetical protein